MKLKLRKLFVLFQYHLLVVLFRIFPALLWKFAFTQRWLANLLFHQSANYPDMYSKSRYPGLGPHGSFRSSGIKQKKPFNFRDISEEKEELLQRAKQVVAFKQRLNPLPMEVEVAKVAVPPPIPSEEPRVETENPFVRKGEKD